jgi:hypothetical protein
MSIFRETFPAFVQNELKRRQDGMLTRNPAFLHQLNSRSAWVRMTSGVDFEGSSALAKNYVLQGGTLFHSIDNNKDNFSQRMGIGNSSMAYSNRSINGEATSTKNRSGIKPMPGITNVAIQSKGAYGSLQEATVTFNCWDIRQLEELELLYMRPGYTVLLEFGWDFAKVNGTTPSYDILNKSNISLNDAFAQIYELIDQSGGTYDALLGYVKNYNWSARDDGGYDCTTSIISLGEVLESLKCNWVPGETKAFDNSGKGILNLPTSTPANSTQLIESYEKGIIPGLIQELWNYGSIRPNKTSSVITDPTTGNYYYLYRQDVREDKSNRGGLVKSLGQGDKTEVYITLGSFCDLLSTYVFPKGASNQSLSELVTYETDYKSESYIKYSKKNTTNSPEALFNSKKPINAYAKSLKCIASPLAISTNLGVCYVRNDNWNNISVQAPATTTAPSTVTPPNDVANAIKKTNFSTLENSLPASLVERIAPNMTKTEQNAPTSIIQVADPTKPYKRFYTYGSNLKNDITKLATDLGNAVVGVTITNGVASLEWWDGTKFISPRTSIGSNTINLLDYFGDVNALYDQLFVYDYDPTPPGKPDIYNQNIIGVKEDPFTDGISGGLLFGSFVPTVDNTKKEWTKQEVIDLLTTSLSNVPIQGVLKQSLTNQIPAVAQQVSNAASSISSKNALPFLETNDGSTKQLGYISNIYVNLNYLYEHAISKNVASSDPQNKNTISIRDYIQGIMRDVQNSLGNINNFDIQVDNRNAIGRIIDINFTGDTKDKLFLLQMHNLNSVVRDYKFSSKIFPEMGSIIAISAQDPEGVGKLGYDNATLVAWNEGISDRLIPKKNFNSTIALNNPKNPNSPVTFLLPFLTKIYNYFQYINGAPSSGAPNTTNDNFNYAYGGLDFAYRDFLANLDRYDPQNRFKTIIPTELTITLDGLGGIIIGNLFKINQDIIPKGYKNTGGRDVAYIVTRLGHQLSGNDWTTELSAYPVVFENAQGTKVWKQWKNNQYPGTLFKVGGKGFRLVNANNGRSNGVGSIPPSVTASTTTQNQIDAMNLALEAVFETNTGAAGLCARYVYTLGTEYIKALKGQALDGNLIKGSGNANTSDYRNALTKLGYKQTYSSSLTKQQVISKIDNGPWNVGDIITYYDPSNPTDLRHTQIYTGGDSPYSGGYLWASSYSDNYTYNFIYNSRTNDKDKFQFYVYTLN